MTEPGQYEPPLTDPAMCRRLVAGALKAARERSGLLQAHVAAKMGWSPSKVLRIENGKNSVSAEGLAALLDLYGIHDQTDRNQLDAAARQAARRSTPVGHGVLSTLGREYVTLERSATRIRLYACALVPDLLTTQPYAAAIIKTMVPRLTPPSVRRGMLDVCLTRQAAVIEAAEPPQLDVVLDESVLRRGFEARTATPDILHEQAARLQQLAARPTIAIGVLPLWHGTAIAAIGSFALLDLPAAVGGRVAYRLNGLGMPIRPITDPTEIDHYTSAFDDLCAESLPRLGLRMIIRDVLCHPSRTGGPQQKPETARAGPARTVTTASTAASLREPQAAPCNASQVAMAP